MGLLGLYEQLEKLDKKINAKNNKNRRIPCDICGQPFSYADKINVANGICCPHCMQKVSPWFDRDIHTCNVLQLRSHIDYRDKNFAEIYTFNPTIEIGDELQLYIDERKKVFIITADGEDYRDVNCDMIPLSAVTSCKYHIEEGNKEILFRDSLGKTGSFTPKAYAYYYDLYLTINTNIPFMSKLEFRINPYRIDNNQECVIQVSEETVWNKMKDMFTTNRMYQGNTNNSVQVKNSDEYRKYENIMMKMFNAINKGKEESKYTYDKTKYIICQWCGSKIDINTSTCPHCGGLNN